MTERFVWQKVFRYWNRHERKQEPLQLRDAPCLRRNKDTPSIPAEMYKLSLSGKMEKGWFHPGATPSHTQSF